MTDVRRLTDPMEFNINNDVWVKITPHGWEEWDRHWEDVWIAWQGLRDTAYSGETLRPDNRDKWQRFQLWELMNCFGPAMYVGAEPCFVGNVIRFTAP